MKLFHKMMLSLAVVGLSVSSLAPIANAKTTEHNGAPKAIKGTWVSRVTKIPDDLTLNGSKYQRTAWYVGNQGLDESGFFYQTKTKPSKFFYGNGSGVDSANGHLKYFKHGKTYYLNSHSGTNYFHYKAKLIDHRHIKLYANYQRQATKWHYIGEYYKLSNHSVNITKHTKINY
ncbi:hypothetical protein ACYATP_07750 [Lactobacillaceae bacterium Melli_B4]